MAAKIVHNTPHKYERVKQGRRKNARYIFRCVLPDCSHFISTEMLAGRKSICYICGNEFVCTKIDYKWKRPHCENCVAKSKLQDKVPTVMEKIKTGTPSAEDLIEKFKKRFGK